MMRKDVRIGFAIGGVLLAVLIVYGLVTSGPNPRDNEVTLAPDDPGAAPKSDADAKSAPANGANGGAAQQTGQTAGATDPLTSGTASRTPDRSGANGAGPLASNPQSRPPTTAPADRWEQALTTGALPSMMVTTETPSSAATDAPAAPETGTAAPNAGAGTATPSDGTAGTGTTAGNSGGAFDARVLTGMANDGAANLPPPSPLPANTSTGSTAPPTGQQRTHTVQPNETFASIAEVAYGSQHYYPHLVRANPKVDPKRLRAGMTIVLPDRAQVVANEPKATEASPLANGAAPGAGPQNSSAALPPIDEKTQYRAQPGESLYKISQKLYGKADKVDAIYNLNKDAIGPNPSRLKAGTVLKLPEPPTAPATAAR